jgi:hypothetical protein
VLLVLGAAAVLLYVHWVGFPDFLKVRVESRLRARGYSVRLGRVWLDQSGSLMVQNLILETPQGDAGPQAVINRAELGLRREALRSFRLRPETLTILRGKISWPVAASNAPPRRVVLDDLIVKAVFPTPKLCQVTHLSGRLLDTDLRATVSLTNFAAISRWHFGPQGGKKSDWANHISQWLSKADELKLAQSSLLNLHVQADGLDPKSLQADCQLEIPNARWPGGSLDQLHLSAHAAPSSTRPGETKLSAELRLPKAGGSWGELTDAGIKLELSGVFTNQVFHRLESEQRLGTLRLHAITGQNVTATTVTLPVLRGSSALRTELNLSADAIQTPWGTSTVSHAHAEVSHRLDSFAAWEVHWQTSHDEIKSPWGEAKQARASGRLAPRSSGNEPASDSTWGIWRRFEPFDFDWTLSLENVVTPKLQLEHAACSGQWRSPEVSLQSLHAELYGGHFDATGRVDVPSRQFQASATLDFDAHRAASLLTTNSQRWLAQFSWQTPPTVSAHVKLTLPEWTDAHPNWREDVMPTVRLDGQFTGRGGAFRGIPVAFASSHFALTNQEWTLPDLVVERPDAKARLQYTGDMQTHDYHWRIEAQANPQILYPVLQEETVRRGLEQFKFGVPPVAKGEIWGRWHDLSSVAFNGHVAATNFTFRGQPCSELAGSIRLDESLLSFSNVIIRQGMQEIRVPSGSFDLTERVVHVTNAISTMDPDLITKVIGPKVHAAFQPYRFPMPPTVRINGRLPTFDIEDADVRFEVLGPSFSYWKLNVTNISGAVHWRGDTLAISNVEAGFYGGQLEWEGGFDFSVPVGANLRFSGNVKNADFHALMADLGRKTNALEGSLDGQLIIANANSDDWRSWQGSGHLKLRDGFLWDIPIFGFFSPVLNTVAPGLGNSRLSAGEATFQIDQSVVRTEDLELKSPALRLRYTGSVDFKGKVDVRMHAEILRDTWGVGRFLSMMFWPISKAFEYKITGTVYHPAHQPVYIPSLLMWPLRPFHSIKKLFVHEKPPPTPLVEDGLIVAPEPERELERDPE